jgi:hypothetical protein
VRVWCACAWARGEKAWCLGVVGVVGGFGGLLLLLVLVLAFVGVDIDV